MLPSVANESPRGGFMRKYICLAERGVDRGRGRIERIPDGRKWGPSSSWTYPSGLEGTARHKNVSMARRHDRHDSGNGLRRLRHATWSRCHQTKRAFLRLGMIARSNFDGSTTNRIWTRGTPLPPRKPMRRTTGWNAPRHVPTGDR